MAKRSVYTLWKGTCTVNAQIVEKLKARVEVVEEIGGLIGDDPKLVETKLAAYLQEEGVSAANATADHKKEEKRRVKEKYLAVVLLCDADCSRAGGPFLKEIKNNALKGQKTFPNSVAEGFGIMNDYSAAASAPKLINDSEGVEFVQEEDIALAPVGNKGREKSNVIFHRCQEKGH
uniref:Uncharacterized protein n=1 Tax=Odontella aurita TaxID=265563 RepID=A0A7S4MY55_9STRA|mmetsp:Transcript_38261/g.114560  ORF Transcript_38261/g.114560 Transcript_38261/m.114560 type:complete len:176 (+) Transcript_38261:716-1243(+)